MNIASIPSVVAKNVDIILLLTCVCTSSIRRSGPKFAARGPSMSEKQTTPPLRYFMYAPELDNQITSIRSSAGST